MTTNTIGAKIYLDDDDDRVFVLRLSSSSSSLCAKGYCEHTTRWAECYCAKNLRAHCLSYFIIPPLDVTVFPRSPREGLAGGGEGTIFQTMQSSKILSTGDTLCLGCALKAGKCDRCPL